MSRLRIVVVAWVITGLGAALGWIVGGMFGPKGAFLGGTVLGTLAVLLSMRILTARDWIDPDRRKGGSIGALVGFALAAPIAALNLDRPLVPVLVTALAGVGMLVGAGRGAAR